MATLTSDYQYLGRSAKLSPQSGSYGYYILLYGKTEANSVTGYHTVSIKEVLACTIDSSFYQYGTAFSGKINGISVFTGTNKPSAAWELGAFSEGGYSYKKGTVIGEGSLSVDCTDGLSHSIPLYCLWTFTATGAAYTPAKGASGAVSVTAALPAIPRINTVTVTDAYIGAVSTVIISKSNPGYTSTLSYRAAGQSGYTVIAEKLSEGQYGWTVPASLYALIPDDKEISVSIRCETFNGSTSMGTSDAVMTATVRESGSLPELSVSAADVNAVTLALTADASKVVRGVSSLRVQTTAAAKNGASVSSVRVMCGGNSVTGADVTISAAESNIVSVTVTDSRGISNTLSVPGLVLVSYIPLTCNPEIQRESAGSGTVNVSVTGNCYNGSFGAQSNALTVKARVKPDGGTYGEYTELAVTLDGSTYTASAALTDVSYTVFNEIEITASDRLTAKTVTRRLSKGTPVFDWGEHDFQFHVPVSVSGSVSADSLLVGGQSAVDFVISESVSGIWRIRKWSSGFCELFGTTPDYTVDITTAWGNFYVADDAVPNQAFPVIFAEVPKIQFSPYVYNYNIGMFLGNGTKPSIAGTGSYGVWRGTSRANTTVRANFYVCGQLAADSN